MMNKDSRYFCGNCIFLKYKEQKVAGVLTKETAYCEVFKERINLDLKCYDCLVWEGIISGQGV